LAVLSIPSLVRIRPAATADPEAASSRPTLDRHTGKPLGATAGAMMFARGGNAVDAACAMLAAVTTMWDVLSWGGETQALIYNPKLKKVIGIDALGVAPSGAPRSSIGAGATSTRPSTVRSRRFTRALRAD
jgi:gamma-glutamyltranspeptidase